MKTAANLANLAAIRAAKINANLAARITKMIKTMAILGVLLWLLGGVFVQLSGAEAANLKNGGESSAESSAGFVGESSGESRAAKPKTAPEFEFVITYRALVENHILKGESYGVAKALDSSLEAQNGARNYGGADAQNGTQNGAKEMQKIAGVCEILTLENAAEILDAAGEGDVLVQKKQQKYLQNALKTHKDAVLDCLRKYAEIHISDTTFLQRGVLRSRTAMSLESQRILALIEGGKIKVKVLESKK